MKFRVQSVAGIVLIGYIRLQSEITASVKHIAAMESTLNSLKVSNDEEYSRIESSVDLDEIRRIAITELGMTYPKANQCIYVTSKTEKPKNLASRIRSKAYADMK